MYVIACSQAKEPIPNRDYESKAKHDSESTEDKSQYKDTKWAIAYKLIAVTKFAHNLLQKDEVMHY